jgi:hypothetical protein
MKYVPMKTAFAQDLNQNDTLGNYLSTENKGPGRDYSNTLNNFQNSRRFSTHNKNLFNNGFVTTDSNGDMNLLFKNKTFVKSKTKLKKEKQANIQLSSTIHSYKEDLFAEIMKLDGITPEDMIKSLSLERNRNMVFKAGEGAGQSGSFFFFSHDNRFLIKTLRGSEKQTMLDILDDYIDHIRATSNKSLLARIYGIFTVKTNYFDPLDIIVMQNTVVLEDKKNQKITFDLKGSTVNRKINFN